jgi:hypothetical protein
MGKFNKNPYQKESFNIIYDDLTSLQKLSKGNQQSWKGGNNFWKIVIPTISRLNNLKYNLKNP